MATDMYNPQGAAFHNKLPMKQISRLNQLDSIEDIHRYRIEYTLGTYYPVRCTPSISIDIDSEIPIVMSAGDIVAIKEIKPKYAYSSADNECGILQSGDVAVSLNVATAAVMKKDIDFLYPRDMSGFIVKANGGYQATDTYSANDVTYGVLTVSGSVPTAGVTTYIRSANKPAGIMGSKVKADFKHRYLNYDTKTSGYSIIPAGVLTLPVITISGSGGTLATVIANVKAAVDAKHQYILLSGTSDTDATILGYSAAGTKLMSSLNGKFIKYDNSDADQVFGKILEKRVRIPYDMSVYDESFPGSQIKGTDTAGLSKRLYDFMYDSLVAAGQTGSALAKETLKTYFYSTLTVGTNVRVTFSNVDVVFGYLAK